MKIAIVSTMNLPTPAVRGGAVETLTTALIDENEKYSDYKFDVYTMFDKQINEEQYKNTKIIQIRINLIEKIYQKLRNLLKKIMGRKPFYNVLYKKAANAVLRHRYDKIIIENNMFLYKLIMKKTNTELIYHMHNDFNDADKTPENYMNIARTASKIITVSNYIKDRCNDIRKTNKVNVLHNAIDEKLYNPDNISDYRKKYNIDKNDIVIRL